MDAGRDGTNRAERQAVTDRLVDAPPELVFRAIGTAENLERWWGPNGFRTTTHEFDFRPGGHWRCTLHGPDAADYDNEYVFAELAPTRVVIDHPDPAHWFRLTILLAEEGGKTRIVWQQVFATRKHYEEVKDFVTPANEQNLDRLEIELARMSGRSETVIRDQ